MALVRVNVEDFHTIFLLVFVRGLGQRSCWCTTFNKRGFFFMYGGKFLDFSQPKILSQVFFFRNIK